MDETVNTGPEWLIPKFPASVPVNPVQSRLLQFAIALTVTVIAPDAAFR